MGTLSILPLPGETLPDWAVELNKQLAEAGIPAFGCELATNPRLADAEEYEGEADSRGLDPSGYNKGHR